MQQIGMIGLEAGRKHWDPWELSQVEFLGKQTLRLRSVCGTFIGGRSQDQHLWGVWEVELGKLGCDDDATKASTYPVWSSEMTQVRLRG